MIGQIHMQTQRLIGGIYEVCLETDSGVMTYIPCFIRTGSDIQKFIVEGYTDTQTAQ
jgi:hypothetical protein